jgi:two-component system, NtrC family, sensor kinase
LNLSLNARDAMPEGGRIKITINTASQSTEDGQGKMAVIEFADTGSGIPENIQERIFEPFFTTKPVDKGTGLGLSQVYGFVKQSNGTIAVSSRVGSGTTFKLFLPLCMEAPKPAKGKNLDRPADVIRQATVLLVEDHPDVSIVAADHLEQLGCKVVQANSAAVAIEALNSRNDFDLVLSDIVMPGMSGLELGRLIREHHPEVPVILTSGYSDKAALATQEGFTLIRKPYSPEVLKPILDLIIKARCKTNVA